MKDGWCVHCGAPKSAQRIAAIDVRLSEIDAGADGRLLNPGEQQEWIELGRERDALAMRLLGYRGAL